MKRCLIVLALFTGGGVASAQTANRPVWLMPPYGATPMWPVTQLPTWFAPPALPPVGSDVSYLIDRSPAPTLAQIESRWKELTFAAAKVIDGAYQAAFIKAVRGQFDLLQARGRLEGTNPEVVIDETLNGFRPTERQPARDAEREHAADRARTAAIDMLRDRLAQLDELQRRLDDQARTDQFLAAIRKIGRDRPAPPRSVHCTSNVLGSFLYTDCN